jgi:hypothetical protein
MEDITPELLRINKHLARKYCARDYHTYSELFSIGYVALLKVHNSERVKNITFYFKTAEGAMLHFLRDRKQELPLEYAKDLVVRHVEIELPEDIQELVTLRREGNLTSSSIRKKLCTSLHKATTILDAIDTYIQETM